MSARKRETVEYPYGHRCLPYTGFTKINLEQIKPFARGLPTTSILIIVRIAAQNHTFTPLLVKSKP